ncbi:hypothetical protein PFISCL1PPCAC_21375, partial [Pristionchus fissidentatus]
QSLLSSFSVKMCSLDFFFKPREDDSHSFFDLGDFRGLGCTGSSQERTEAIQLLFVIFTAGALLAGILICCLKNSLKQGEALAKRCDLLEKAVIEHDEYCSKHGIRGRAE